jgi:hypothetical protein
MKRVAALASYLALGLVVLPPLAFALHAYSDLPTVKGLMLTGTVVWFIAAPIWLRQKA